MKKILTLFLLLTTALVLAACARVRNNPPTIEANKDEFSIIRGQVFDPLEGVVARDQEDTKGEPYAKDKIDVTLSEEYLDDEGRWVGPIGSFSYSVIIEDASGETASVNMKVNVARNTIEIEGPDNITHYVNYPLTYESQYKAEDLVSGDISASLIFNVSAVDFTTASQNAYKMIVSAKDAIGTEVTKEVSIMVRVDDEAPTITLPSQIIYVIGDPAPDYKAGVKAEDKVEGDITNRIEIDASEVDLTQEGTYFINYTVTDLAGNKSPDRVQTIRVLSKAPQPGEDIIPPTINAPLKTLYLGYERPESAEFWLAGVTAVDNVDEVVYVLFIFEEVDVTKEGTYTVYYTAVDSAGNVASITGEARVIKDTESPQIEGLKTSYDITTELYYTAEYFKVGLTANDNAEGDVTNKIEADISQVQLGVPGTYPITFTVADLVGNVTTVTRNVVIQQGAPKIIGVDDRQSYYLGSNTYDPLRGVTAVDGVGNDITDRLVVIGSPQIVRPGRSSFTISVTDAAGVTTSIGVSLVTKAKVDIPETFDTTTPITIKLWHGNGSTIEAALKRYALDFQKLYPNVTVVIEKIGNNYDDVRQATIDAIRGGSLPNLVQSYPDHVMEYIDNNALVSVTPYYDHPVHGYDNSATGSFSDIVASYRRENNQYTSEGDYFALPFNKSTEVVIYNKTYYDRLVAAGKAPAEFPTTWQQLFALEAVFKADANAYMDEMFAFHANAAQESVRITTEQLQDAKNKFIPFSYDSQDNAFITLIRQWGGQYTGINADRKGQILFDNAEAREMLNYFYENRGNITVPSNWGTDYASDLFKKGFTFVTVGSTGGVRYNVPDLINGEYPFEFDVVPMLYNEERPELQTAIQQGTNISMTTQGNAQEKLASWLFLKYLTSFEVQKDFSILTGYHPIRSSIYEDEDYKLFLSGSYYKKDSTGAFVVDANGDRVIEPLVGEELMKSLASNAAALQADKTFFDQAFVGSSTARKAVGVAFEQVMLGSNSSIINTSLAQAYAEAMRVLGN